MKNSHCSQCELIISAYLFITSSYTPESNCSKKEYLGKDYVHPNKLGGKIVADNVDLDWFKLN